MVEQLAEACSTFGSQRQHMGRAFSVGAEIDVISLEKETPSVLAGRCRSWLNAIPSDAMQVAQMVDNRISNDGCESCAARLPRPAPCCHFVVLTGRPVRDRGPRFGGRDRKQRLVRGQAWKLPGALQQMNTARQPPSASFCHTKMYSAGERRGTCSRKCDCGSCYNSDSREFNGSSPDASEAVYG